MGTTVRYYLFPTEGKPQRLSHRVAEGLVFGSDCMPQFANTRQRILSAWLDNDEGQPQQIKHYQATIWSFDGNGSITDGLRDGLLDVMDSMSREDHIKARGGTVIPLGPEISKRRLVATYRWQPTSAELDAVAADIWPKGKSDRLKVAPGIAAKKPSVTYEAKHALTEASEPFWKVSHAIGQLKEPSLAGFIFAARNQATDPDYGILYAALADMGERRLEILKRRRRDKGTWIAFVELLTWNSDRSIAETTGTYHVECKSRSLAVHVARKLLAKHADRFAENTTVEAGIETDLEWEAAARTSTPESDILGQIGG